MGPIKIIFRLCIYAAPRDSTGSKQSNSFKTTVLHAQLDTPQRTRTSFSPDPRLGMILVDAGRKLNNSESQDDLLAKMSPAESGANE
jgi:hypothetical protein